MQFTVSMSLFQIRSMFSFGSATYWSYISNYLQLRLINIPDLRNFLPSVCKAFFFKFLWFCNLSVWKVFYPKKIAIWISFGFFQQSAIFLKFSCNRQKANTTLWKLLYINLKILMIEPTVTFIENFGHVTLSPSCIVMDSLDLRVDQFEASISSLCASPPGTWICLHWFV